jgi:hypothetical protein
MIVEDREGATIGRHRVVIKVAADDRSQPFPLERDCLMSPPSQFLRDFLEFCPHAVSRLFVEAVLGRYRTGMQCLHLPQPSR